MNINNPPYVLFPFMHGFVDYPSLDKKDKSVQVMGEAWIESRLCIIKLIHEFILFHEYK